MWAEPLTAATDEIDPYTVEVVVRAGDGTRVAAVRCAYSRESAFGLFGEMRTLDADGAPRQRLRALALLVREALRFAADAGVARVRTDAPERLRAFATAICGLEPLEAGGVRVYAGELHAVRSYALQHSDADGNLDELTAEEAGAIDAAITVSG